MNWTPETRAARVDAILAQAPVVPVLAIERVEDAVPLARALVDAGLPVLEITLRTPCALDAMRAVVIEVPNAVVGAGTMLRSEDFRAVEATGAVFGISPGATPTLYDAAELSALAFLPGVATATELMIGMERGYRRFKFFPAEGAGGVVALKAFAGPFPEIRFCPTGGIDAAKASSYFALRNVATVGGSWMVPADALASRDWDRIGRLAREAAGLRAR
ncbi:bifunctional 4-hydroxy-2-oxoglutarate aldolase/2-dehydro-3-deoxy-phosphogluconate aldolase [Cognatilysobacter terrigena]|uniref:bifunctional 4-hydroxy-2-oxoglutarate aldolase/2-dehydro-3-deoxy-phosphogluconate aldolase n=1 Tax=Cognatilysobacter terrigena TaxID=2488749 RepID=UPI00105E3BA4|nr:bifunctional 4-hydroxy-2-oxoglutarate aldolase/2-dehydro-3-deoxy-phosphogluconate aldolase [Lysobacter terrigena]